MSCVFSREVLALHVEGDLAEAAAHIASQHLARCGECRQFFEQLRARQSMLKSLRRETVSPSACAGMRREVMAIVTDRGDRSGWMLRIERAIVLGFRGRSYALAAAALVAIVSVSMLAQMRYAGADRPRSDAVFEGGDTLLRPEGYRDWVLVGPRATLTRTHNVYVNPAGYRTYAETGKFPEGTLMIWESLNQDPRIADRPHKESPVLLASVKDSTRFGGGWGFFDFTGPGGTVTSRAQVLPESSGCRACHWQDGETDHVFTQFYPVLRSARHRTQLAATRGRARA